MGRTGCSRVCLIFLEDAAPFDDSPSIDPSSPNAPLHVSAISASPSRTASPMWTITAKVVSPYSTASLTEGELLSMRSTWSTQTETGTGIRAPAWFASCESHSNTPSRVPPGVIRRTFCFLLIYRRSIDTHRSYKAVRTVLRQSSMATSEGTGHRRTTRRKTMRPFLLLLSETPPETQTFDTQQRKA